MLYFITMDDNKFTIELFLEQVKSRLSFSTSILDYKEAKGASFKDAVVIFCDLERFTDDDIVISKTLYDKVIKDRPRAVLNNPYKVLRRFELLKKLREQGINSFDVHHPPIKDKPIHYPVFVRNELDHYGPVSDLLSCEMDLVKTLENAKGKKQGPFLPLITEYCDVTSKGMGHHKYGAFCLAGHIVPRHLFFSDQWMVKGTKDQLSHHIDIERAYLDNNDFSKALEHIFKIANIDYGRADFAITGLGPQVFEINTNPTVLDAGDLKSNRKYVTDSFLKAFTTAMEKTYHSIV